MDFLSNSISFPIITALLLLVVVLFISNKKDGKKYHPVVGTVLDWLINYNTLHHYMTDLAAKNKTYRVIGFFHSNIYTSDPANVEYILKTNFENYGKGTYNHKLMKELLGEGIFTVDGEKWRQQRKVSSHEFSTKVLRDFSSAIFTENAIKLGNMFSDAADSNQILNINDLFMKATTDSIFRVGFGIELDNLIGSNEEGVKFSRAFDEANELTFRRFIDMSWRIKRFFNIGFEAKLKKSVKVIDDFIYKVIQVKSAQMQKSKDDSLLTKEDILSRFVHITDNDPKFLRDIILSFVLAGKDPIALTMCWFIYELCKHPEIQSKVAKEIRETLNVNEETINVAELAARVSEDSLEKMQYLHAALTETLRLYPAVPVDPKICFSDDVLPDGCSVKKGQMVAFNPYAMGKMTYIWGDDAHEFKPERWIDRNGRFRTESPYKFTAFQAGPRTCLGRDFAYRQLKIFSSVLLGCFTFKLSDENKVPMYRISINLHIDGPLQIRVFKRSGLHNP